MRNARDAARRYLRVLERQELTQVLQKDRFHLAVGPGREVTGEPVAIQTRGLGWSTGGTDAD